MDHVSELSTTRCILDHVDDLRDEGGGGGAGGVAERGAGITQAHPLAMLRAETHGGMAGGSASEAENELRHHLKEALALKRIVQEEIDVVAAHRRRQQGLAGREDGEDDCAGISSGKQAADVTDDLALGEEASSFKSKKAIDETQETSSNEPPHPPPRLPARKRRPPPAVNDAEDVISGQPSNVVAAAASTVAAGAASSAAAETGAASTPLLAAEEVRKICQLAGVLNNILERVNSVPEVEPDYVTQWHQREQQQQHQSMSPQQQQQQTERLSGHSSFPHWSESFQYLHQQLSHQRQAAGLPALPHPPLPPPRGPREETFQETIKTLVEEYQRREEEADVLSEVFSFLDSVDMTEEQIAHFPTFDGRLHRRGRR